MMPRISSQSWLSQTFSGRFVQTGHPSWRSTSSSFSASGSSAYPTRGTARLARSASPRAMTRPTRCHRPVSDGLNADPLAHWSKYRYSRRLPVRPERNQRASEEDSAPDPEPEDQWIHEDKEARRPIGLPAGQHDVEIIQRRAPQGDFRIRLGFEVHVELLRRLEPTGGMAVLLNGQVYPDLPIAGEGAFLQMPHRQGIAADRRRGTGTEHDVLLKLVEMRADDRDRDQDDANVDNVPAVAPAVRADDVYQRQGRVLAGAHPYAYAPDEFLQSGREDEGADKEGHVGRCLTDSRGEQEDRRACGDHQGDPKVAPQGSWRSAPPWHQRPNAHQGDER